MVENLDPVGLSAGGILALMLLDKCIKLIQSSRAKAKGENGSCNAPAMATAHETAATRRFEVLMRELQSNGAEQRERGNAHTEALTRLLERTERNRWDGAERRRGQS